MMKVNLCLSVVSLLCALLMVGCNSSRTCEKKCHASNVKLDPLFTDHMVLQRGKTIKIRGWADPNSVVKVELGDSRTKAIAGPDGEWLAKLPAMEAGGPYKLTISANLEIVLDDILIGDVWICSGQSNMQMSVAGSQNSEMEIKQANYPKIRLFTVDRIASVFPVDKLIKSSGWQVCSPETIAHFSAVGYFFGREVYKKLDVPVGLINTSWGGTVAEAWTSLEMVNTLPSFQKRVATLEKYDDNWRKNEKKRMAELTRLLEIRQKDIKKLCDLETNTDFQKKMAAPQLDDSKWEVIASPNLWMKSKHGLFNGLYVFRKTISIPKEWSGKDLILSLGAVDEVETTYFNGVKVGGKGNIAQNKTQYWDQPRSYTIPAKLVKTGNNTITCFIYNLVGGGGFLGGKEGVMKICPPKSTNRTISLNGEWKYKPALEIAAIPNDLTSRIQNNPSFLFNSMINPLLNFPITGAIWYQGESNAGRAYQYRRLFPAMIQDWRIRWQQGDFPFYFVQLANFMESKTAPADSSWAELREAQSMALRLPYTGMAVIIDIGDAKNIHPKNKQDVGKRLAQNAFFQYYKNAKLPAGPLFKSVTFKDGKASLAFDNVGKGLMARSGDLKGFSIAGSDKKFVWAKAKIVGDKIVVWNDQVKTPIAVRYAWADNPECNLYNKDGFPASPFRTDDWTGVTLGKE